MTTPMLMIRIAVIAVSLVGAPLVHADLTGSFDGQMTGKKITTPIDVAAGLTQIGTAVTGTVAVGGDPSIAGAYIVNGKATTKRVKLSGLVHGVRFSWNGKILGDTMTGKTKLKGGGVKVAGSLTLARNVSTGDGSTCDAVYTANQTLFQDQVLGQALITCTACHVTGGQAAMTRFHVTTGDPLATAREIALLVDSANPSSSRIRAKPLDLVPHGGGVQITDGSPQDQTLQQWIDLVAQAHCN